MRHGCLADIYLNGTFFMKINLMPASDKLVTWSEFIKIKDDYNYQTDSICNTLFDVLMQHDKNMTPCSYIIRINGIIISDFDRYTSWADLCANHGSDRIAINVLARYNIETTEDEIITSSDSEDEQEQRQENEQGQGQGQNFSRYDYDSDEQ
jgi:hypothetical protein